MDLLPGDRRAICLAALALALYALMLLGEALMKRVHRILIAAALTAAALGLSGCLTPFGRELVGELPRYEIRKEPPVRCSDLVDRIAQSDPADPLSQPQQQALYRACEDFQKGTIIDPQKARESLGVGTLIP